MAFTYFRRTVTTSATLLFTHPSASASSAGDYGNQRVTLINVSTTPATVVLGDSAVAASTGARWVIDAGRSLSVEVEPGESLYGITATGTQDIDVLANGR